MKIAVVGAGYVGTTAAYCFASRGLKVNVIEKNPLIVEKLQNGRAPIFEPFLDDLVRIATDASRVQFFPDFSDALAGVDLVLLAVGTPVNEADGSADLAALWQVVEGLAPHLDDGATIVIKSTVPVGTNRRVRELIRRLRPDLDFSVASNPEFLREGSAVRDFFHADRIVFGVSDDRARDRLRTAYDAIVRDPTQIVFTTPENAELSKYAANAFLALKVSFINEIADLCERAGGDVRHVARIIGMDRRIGAEFLAAGPGYGGSCFPKDTRALATTAADLAVPTRIVEAAIAANDARKAGLARRVLGAIAGRDGAKVVAVLGVAFKANTDDIRDAPSLDLIRQLLDAGCRVQVHDPVCAPRGRVALPDADWFDDPVDAAAGADALVIVTDWDAYRHLDPAVLARRMRGRHVFDFRHVVDPVRADAAGLALHAVGRAPGQVPPALEVWSPEPDLAVSPYPAARQRVFPGVDDFMSEAGE